MYVWQIVGASSSFERKVSLVPHLFVVHMWLLESQQVGARKKCPIEFLILSDLKLL